MRVRETDREMGSERLRESKTERREIVGESGRYTKIKIEGERYKEKVKERPGERMSYRWRERHRETLGERETLGDREREREMGGRRGQV